MNGKLKYICLVIILTILLADTVSALSYEEKPKVRGYIVGTNHLVRGDCERVDVVVYNSAERKKVDYYDVGEAQFFAGREEMLFTAYNVNVTLEGNKYIEVKTSEQEIPALPPLKPVTLPFVVKVKDDAKAGKYELKLKVSFDIIDDLVDVDTFSNTEWSYYEKQVSGSNVTTIYKYKPITEYYELRYKHVSYEIPLTVYIDKKPVKLEIVKVNTYNFRGKSKGKIVIWVKNVGEKVGKNAYLVLETPSGFTASSLSISQPTTSAVPMQTPPAMPIPTQMPSAMPTPSIQPMPSTPSQPAYYVGDLKPNETVKAVFYVKINVKEEGNYTFKIKAVYLNEFGKTVSSDLVPFGVHVANAPIFSVKSVKSKVYVNAEGDVIVTIVPSTNLNDVSVYLSTNPPLSVLSSEYYLGDVKAGKEYTAIFKLQASDSAKPVIYPAQIKVKYKSLDEYFFSDPISIGIKVYPKIKFLVIGTPKIQAGQEAIVSWTIKNIGPFTFHDATARLTITDPFSSSDDTAYIGTLKPNQSATIKFKLSVDSDATPKKYSLNLEVKFKNPDDQWAISEPSKAPIIVTPHKPPYGAIAVVAIAAILSTAYYLRRRR
ncbi:COG1361 S-layer family protein, partial [Archaeoglobus sp.]